MSNTRYSKTGEFNPEAKLACAAVCGINIGLNIVTKIARAMDDEAARAALWLTNYAIYRKRTADALSSELDLDKGSIRGALTDPEFDDMPRFVEKVKALRRRFEDSLPVPPETEVTRTVKKACRFAMNNRAIVEVVGKTRMGKSEGGREYWLRHLDEVIWFECPSDESDKSFMWDLAAIFGVSTTGGKKTGVIRSQVMEILRSGFIKVIVIDEGHRLWPADVRAKPRRIEFVREAYQDGRGCSVLILATPQYSESLDQSLEKAGRWAPGQYEGRVVRYHLKDSMPDADLAAVARHHGPDLSDDMVDILVTQAKASEGFCGIMVNTIKLAREEVDEGQPITLTALRTAMKQQMQSTRIGTLARQLKKAA